MKRLFAAFLFASTACLAAAPSFAQDAPAAPTAASEVPAQDDGIKAILNLKMSPETEKLARQLVELTGTARMFDDVLPNVADQTKNAFIRSNPQMQLGIISVVDKVAVQLVARRPELDTDLARVWASGFTNDEMQDLVTFFGSDTGKKFSTQLPKILGVETAVAQAWGQAVGAEMASRVKKELANAMAAEQQALQSDVAGPAAADGAQQQPAAPKQ
jgi:hypothetical protein